MNQLTSEEKEVYLEAFNLFDEDKNGTIDWQELKNIMKQLGKNVTDDEAKQLIADCDHDNNGTIDFEEFVSLMVRPTDEASNKFFKISHMLIIKNFIKIIQFFVIKSRASRSLCHVRSRRFRKHIKRGAR